MCLTTTQTMPKTAKRDIYGYKQVDANLGKDFWNPFFITYPKKSYHFNKLIYDTLKRDVRYGYVDDEKFSQVRGGYFHSYRRSLWLFGDPVVGLHRICIPKGTEYYSNYKERASRSIIVFKTYFDYFKYRYLSGTTARKKKYKRRSTLPVPRKYRRR